MRRFTSAGIYFVDWPEGHCRVANITAKLVKERFWAGSASGREIRAGLHDLTVVVLIASEPIEISD